MASPPFFVAGTKQLGYVPTVQADGSLAWSEPTGTPGTDGEDGTDGVSWHSGNGAPEVIVGHNTIEASSDQPGSSAKIVQKATGYTPGYVTRAYVYQDGAGAISGPTDTRFVLYDDTAASPDALLGYSATVAIPDVFSLAWVEYLFTAPVLLDGTDMWYGYHTNLGATSLRRVAGGTFKYNVTDTFSDGPSNPFGSPSLGNSTYSMYMVVSQIDTSPNDGDFYLDETNGEVYKYEAGSWGSPFLILGSGGGDVASDVIWDAKGDLAVGTGSDVADNLAVGTNGKFLKANSAQTTGLEWATLAEADVTNLVTDLSTLTAAAAAKIPNALVDAKGDILTATANDTPARLAVGTNDFLLTAASGQATGLIWQKLVDAQVAAGQNLSKLAAVTGTPNGLKFLRDDGSWQVPIDTGIPVTILDVKGDIIAATAADTASRLAAGANDTVLTAASGQTTGLIWQKITDAQIAASQNLSKLAAVTGTPSGLKFLRDDGSWQVPIDTDTLPVTILDAKGDLIVASAADTAGREPVGSNDNLLVADSAQTRGVKWAKLTDSMVAASQNLSKLAAVTGTPTGLKFLRDDGSWQVPAGGGGGSVATDTIFDAKGDLAVGTGSDTAAKLTVGANEKIIVADSTQSTGLAWADKPIFRAATALGYQPIETLMDQQNENAKTVLSYTPVATGTIGIARVYLDGLGTGVGNQDIRAVVYSDSAGAPNALLGSSDTVTVIDNQAAGWVEFVFSTPVVLANTNPIWFGFHSGPAATSGSVIRFASHTASGSVKFQNVGGDTFSDGAANPFGTVSGTVTRTYCQYMEIFPTASIPGDFAYAVSSGRIYRLTAGAWQFQTSGVPTDAVRGTIVDAKGDLIAASAADTPARVAAGANGQVLSAQSGQAAGLQWVDVKETIFLQPSGANLPDGSTNNLGPQLVQKQGTQTGRKAHYTVLAFDGAGALEAAYWTFRLPSNYLSGGTLKIQWNTANTSGDCKWQAQVAAVTPADADTPLEHAFAAAAAVTTTANTTEAQRLVESSITLTMDSAAPGDLITLMIFRDSADAADTLAVDANLIAASVDVLVS